MACWMWYGIYIFVFCVGEMEVRSTMTRLSVCRKSKGDLRRNRRMSGGAWSNVAAVVHMDVLTSHPTPKSIQHIIRSSMRTVWMESQKNEPPIRSSESLVNGCWSMVFWGMEVWCCWVITNTRSLFWARFQTTLQMFLTTIVTETGPSHIPTQRLRPHSNLFYSHSLSMEKGTIAGGHSASSNKCFGPSTRLMPALSAQGLTRFTF